MQEVASELELVLVGGGHAHVSVLRRIAMGAWHGVRVTLISREVHTPYSGMLPGHVAGHYDFDDVHIDLGPLAAAAGARLLHASIDGIDPERRQVRLAGRPPLSYDLLSLDTGATPTLSDVEGAIERVLPVKPISAFLPRLEALLARIAAADRVLDVAVVGAGPGGVELALALAVRLERDGHGKRARLHLLCAGDDPLPDQAAAVRRRFRAALAARGVVVHLRARVSAVGETTLATAAGERMDADEVLWVTHAAAPPWARAAGLAVDERGFVEVGPTLQSRSHDDIFAAGDLASLAHAPRPKSGVFAVRAGPVLADNLLAWIRAGRLRHWVPQRHALYLITTGARSAVSVRPGWPVFEGAWVWRWKDWIDRRFMARFRDLPVMATAPPPSVVAPSRGGGAMAAGMRCVGCGSKVGSGILRAALAASAQVGGDRRGDETGAGQLPPFEDAATLRVAGLELQQTIDGFPLPVSDPWIGARIATLHALGDVHAMGARPVGALILATLPFAAAGLMESDLTQMMAGVRHELDAHDCPLLGGHSCEGAHAALGVAVTGRTDDGETPLGKGAGQAGDVLILVKALGTGVILAGTADGRLPSRFREAAIAHMLVSNRDAVAVLRAHECRACTDVTGFGLLGHALEVADASGLRLSLDASAPRALPGALEGLAAGVASTLQADNERALAQTRLQGIAADAPRLRLLCDPQTAGGLLASLPEPRAQACLAALHAAGFTEARVVGRLESPVQDDPLAVIEASRGA